jgi:hypothetical protein
MGYRVLLDADGNTVQTDEGSSSLITLQFYDLQNEVLDGASIETLTLKLYNLEDRSIINSRDGVSILNENGGTLDSDGTLTLFLDPEDNVNVATVLDLDDKVEVHVAEITWTWLDAGANERTRTEPFILFVVPLNSPPE